jgi:hypothetical protein
VLDEREYTPRFPSGQSAAAMAVCAPAARLITPATAEPCGIGAPFASSGCEAPDTGVPSTYSDRRPVPALQLCAMYVIVNCR